ncbi:ATPase inhibitor, mitochondrial-like [Lepus europaeus]|uniref:ATPase inhibitor, mitochondrial-like n=1 Tax=Lepus europaeus TaxID=9983 RepID=UPI002B484877|nr:ATPase inhibitor, mitochondrial-like [Lepus europaeus]
MIGSLVLSASREAARPETPGVLRCSDNGRLCVGGAGAARDVGREGKPEDIHGKAGSIREAGGAFGKREQAEEERYFRAKTKELAALKKHHEDEIVHRKQEIERLQKEIEGHKQKIKSLNSDD